MYVEPFRCNYSGGRRTTTGSTRFPSEMFRAVGARLLKVNDFPSASKSSFVRFTAPHLVATTVPFSISVPVLVLDFTPSPAFEFDIATGLGFDLYEARRGANNESGSVCRARNDRALTSRRPLVAGRQPGYGLFR
ncbi:hypothetical protein EVAR_90226_1 [Eumeta japonica]|uniref:Uncharacterized protein n=1 Tax=Eumeta variegata TaxID=151549 RepID=A0A4C1YR05_EUMVA|nr:hypothetical protein EVAR_90226_1 [Eumeta japonica]